MAKVLYRPAAELSDWIAIILLFIFVIFVLTMRKIISPDHLAHSIGIAKQFIFGFIFDSIRFDGSFQNLRPPLRQT